MNLHLNDTSILNAIIKSSKSIKSISFENYITSFEILKQIFNNSPTSNSIIKSLKIEIDSDQDIDKFYKILNNSNFKSNKTLKKLLIDRYEISLNHESRTETLGQMFKYLRQNKSLEALSLDYFGIRNHKLLSPLIKIQNITKFYTNFYGLDAALKHCNLNKNIKELHYIDRDEDHDNDDDMDDDDDDEEMDEDEDDSFTQKTLNTFKRFFKNGNTSSLNTIRIKSLADGDYLQEKLIEFGKKCNNFPNIIIENTIKLNEDDNDTDEDDEDQDEEYDEDD